MNSKRARIVGRRMGRFAMHALLLGCMAHAQAQTTRVEAVDPSRAKVLAFAQDAGAAAGAFSVCNPQAYTAVRLCGILIFTHWQDLGQEMPSDGDMSQAIENTWEKAAATARTVQAGISPPQSCSMLAEKARGMQIWKLCASAQRMESKTSKPVSGTPPNGQQPTVPVQRQPRDDGFNLQ